MKKNPRLVAVLMRHLERECLLYERHIKVLIQERDALTKFKSEMMVALTDKRERIVRDMKEYEARRFELLSELPRGNERRLRDLIEDHFSGSDKRKLFELANRLHQLVEQSRTESQEFSMVNRFALNVVNGSISLIWQGTQNVTKGYNPIGGMTESYTPSRSRLETVLRQA